MSQQKVGQGQGHQHRNRQDQGAAPRLSPEAVADKIAGGYVTALYRRRPEARNQDMKDHNDRHHEARGHDEAKTYAVGLARVAQQRVPRVGSGV